MDIDPYPSNANKSGEKAKVSKREVFLNIPNLISFGRILCIPVTVWLILNGLVLAAFWVFGAACISDALDGFIAKRFDLESAVGAFLDPIADKALLVSVFVTLGQVGLIDSWLVILVVFRDLVIVTGAMSYYFLFHNLPMKPLLSSKINTTVQMVLVAMVMGVFGFSLEADTMVAALIYLTAGTTVWSGGAYVLIWGHRATSMEPGE